MNVRITDNNIFKKNQKHGIKPCFFIKNELCKIATVIIMLVFRWKQTCMKLFGINITRENKKSYNRNYWINLSQLFNNDVVFDKQTFYDLYAKNGDIRQCVKKISWSVARNGIYLQDNERQTVEDNIVTDEVANLFKTPTFAKFKTNFYRNYLCSGELYIKPIRNVLGVCIRCDVVDSRASVTE